MMLLCTTELQTTLLLPLDKNDCKKSFAQFGVHLGKIIQALPCTLGSKENMGHLSTVASGPQTIEDLATGNSMPDLSNFFHFHAVFDINFVKY